MTVLATTLTDLIGAADHHFHNGRLGRAQRAYIDVLERAQERTDRPSEVVARSMLAQCALRIRDLEEATEHIRVAARLLDPRHLRSHGRYRASLARLAIERGPSAMAREELVAYLSWAEAEDAAEEVLDACLLMSHAVPLDERIEWLERGIDHALRRGLQTRIGEAHRELASALDQVGRTEEALTAYEAALDAYEGGRPRDVGATTWAIGSVACRLEDWPLARTKLEAALVVIEPSEDCADLVALVLADLASVYEAAGDVIEARRLLLRALRLGGEQRLDDAWPERWAAIQRYAAHLEVG